MGNPLYVKGRRKEYRIANELKKKGYITTRSAGSHGVFDVIAVNPDTRIIRLIQAKAGGYAERQIKKLKEKWKHLNGVYSVFYEAR